MMNMQTTEAAPYLASSLDHVLSRMCEVFGEDSVQLRTGDHFRIVDEDYRIVAFPGTIEELSEMLKLAASERWRVIPAGAGTWLDMGNRPMEFHLVMSSERLKRVLEYEPADLTATLQAGCTLRGFNQLASGNGQFIPLDPFGDANSTIGGIVASASSGPLRCAYGTPRDWLIGIRVVDAAGEISSAGGKVVKNVAGYDLCKLYAGSFGTLAVIAEASFKLRTLPPNERTLLFYGEPDGLSALVARIIDSELQPSSCEMLSPSDLKFPIEPSQYALALRFLNETEAVDWQITNALQLADGLQATVMSDEDAKSFWQLYHESETAERWIYSLRLSGLPSGLNQIISDLTRLLPKAHWRAHAINGVIRVHAEVGWLDEFKGLERYRKVADLRKLLESRGGQLVILRAKDEVKTQLDVWGDVGSTASLMLALKGKFDPQRQLNPGRFVVGI
jgi:glycolate dehydrogenase FAD-binding subunit